MIVEEQHISGNHYRLVKKKYLLFFFQILLNDTNIIPSIYNDLIIHLEYSSE